jgi:hypothetical protein
VRVADALELGLDLRDDLAGALLASEHAAGEHRLLLPGHAEVDVFAGLRDGRCAIRDRRS